MGPEQDPRLMDVGGVPIIKDYAPPGALALNGPPIEPVPGVAAPTNDPSVVPATKPLVRDDATVLAALRNSTPPLINIPGTGGVPAAAGATAPNTPPTPGGGVATDFAKPKVAASTGPAMGTTTETTTSRTKGVKADKASLLALDKSFLAEKDAVDEAAKTGVKQAAEEAGYHEQMNAELQRQADVAEDKRIMHQRALDEQESRVSTAMQDFRSKKLDPEAYWKEKGTGAKVMSAIAIALGQLGAGLSGGHNAALDIVNDAVNKNIEAQKEEIANARENVNMEHNLYGQLRQKGMDDREADHAARQLYMEAAQRQLEGVASKYKSDVIKNNAAQMSAQLDKQAADAGVQRSLASQDRVTIQSQSKTAPLTGAHGGAQQLPAGEAAKLGEANAAAENVRALQAKYKDHAGGVMGWIKSKLPFVQNDAKRYENDANVAAQVVGGYLEGGKLTETDLDRYKKMLPHAGDTEETAKSKMNAIVNQIGTRQRGEKEALGAAGYNVSGIKDAAANVGSFKPR